MIADVSHHGPPGLDSLAPVINRFGYLAVVGLVLIEDFGVPVPGETVLVVAAVYAGTGRLNVILVALAGFCGAVLGDNVGFALGHFGGRRLVERYGRYIFFTPQRLDRATGFFKRRGGKLVVIARFVEGLRQANGIIAGTTGMLWRRFLIFNAIGAALWVAVWTCVGDLSGSHIDTIYNDATRYDTDIAIAFGVVAFGYVAWRLARRHGELRPSWPQRFRRESRR